MSAAFAYQRVPGTSFNWLNDNGFWKKLELYAGMLTRGPDFPPVIARIAFRSSSTLSVRSLMMIFAMSRSFSKGIDSCNEYSRKTWQETYTFTVRIVGKI
jgi:hypothetical protein